jgi:hypothetical protein
MAFPEPPSTSATVAILPSLYHAPSFPSRFILLLRICDRLRQAPPKLWYLSIVQKAPTRIITTVQPPECNSVCVCVCVCVCVDYFLHLLLQ